MTVKLCKYYEQHVLKVSKVNVVILQKDILLLYDLCHQLIMITIKPVKKEVFISYCLVRNKVLDVPEPPPATRKQIRNYFTKTSLSTNVKHANI